MKWPLGILARSRRDWAIQQQEWYSATYEQAGGGGPQISLNNDDALGRRLAVYAIVPWTASYPQLVSVYPIKRIDTGNPTANVPVIFGTASISGRITGLARIDTGGTSSALTVKADGSLIAMPDGSPMFIIPSGAQLVVYAMTPYATNLTSGYLICSFLWGYW